VRTCAAAGGDGIGGSQKPRRSDDVDDVDVRTSTKHQPPANDAEAHAVQPPQPPEPYQATTWRNLNIDWGRHHLQVMFVGREGATSLTPRGGSCVCTVKFFVIAHTPIRPPLPPYPPLTHTLKLTSFS